MNQITIKKYTMSKKPEENEPYTNGTSINLIIPECIIVPSESFLKFDFTALSELSKLGVVQK